MTDRSAEIAATLAKLAALLADQQEHQEQQHAPSVPQPRQMPGRVLFTVEEAAQQLGIGRTKAFALVRSGELDSVHIGRLRRVPKSAIDEYAARLVTQQSACQRAA